MTTVNVLHRPQSPSGGSPRQMQAELIGSLAKYTDDFTTTVLGEETFNPDSTGLVTMALRPNSEMAQTDTYYRIMIARSDVVYYCVVPDSGPVQLVNILVDPTTLNPVGPVQAPLFQLRGEKAQANGYASLDSGGKVPSAQLPVSGGGVPSTRLVSTSSGIEGGGDLSADRTLVLSAAVLALLALAGTATQPADLSAAIAALTKASVGLPNVDNTSDANKPVSTAQDAAIDLRGLQAFSTTEPFIATFGPCGVTGTTWTVCPAAYRSLPVTASVGDLVMWNPEVILGAVTASADAEFDLAAIDNSVPASPVRLRCLSSNNATPLDNGHGGLYCWQNNSRRLPSAPWRVQSGDLVGGTLTLALLYKSAGSGLSVGHGTVYPSRISVSNFGKVPS